MIERTTGLRTKFVHEGEYVVAVEVEEFDDQNPIAGWGPYLSYADAIRLERAQWALRAGDLATARSFGRVYRMTPVLD